MSEYRCVHCGKTMHRDSLKAWVKSFCEKSGYTVHLQKLNAEAHSQKGRERGPDNTQD